MNFDTFQTQRLLGPNPGAVHRGYADVEIYALKPVELFLPAVHRIPQVAAWAQQAYYSRAVYQGEPASPYLGLVGIAALGWLLWFVLKNVVRQNTRDIPLHFWGLLWIAAYSVVGGLNSLLGATGLTIFRCTNRYSIVILTLLLLFLIRQLSAALRARRPVLFAVSALLLLVGIADQTPVVMAKSQWQATRTTVRHDAAFVGLLEKKLPPGAMIFQLPAMAFPEVPPVLGVADYELLRPYLFSRHLRFAYGNNKGRGREFWESTALKPESPAFITQLEHYGFSALFIARDGYADKGAAILADLRALGRTRILAASLEWTCLALQPSARPTLPPEFGPNWAAFEGAPGHHWRWSLGNASMVFHHAESTPRRLQLDFAAGTIIPRRLNISMRGEVLADLALDPTAPPTPVHLELTLKPGANELRFETDVPASRGSETDRRPLAFRLVDWKITDTD